MKSIHSKVINRRRSPGRLSMAAVALVVMAGFFCLGMSESRAAGLLLADGGFGGRLEIETHDVEVTVNNGVAVTRVTQVFRNTENRPVEALYSFPVPRGASVSNFSMWINGKEMVGEVLEKRRAREIYESYKRTRKDPGLLEQVDYKTFEMRIFPIAPGVRQRVELTYYQELSIDHDQATYWYPLATVTRGPADGETAGRFSMNVDIRSAIPVVSLVSPSHPQAFVGVRHGQDHYQASLELADGSLAEDVVLHFGLERPRTGLDLVTSRRSGEDGYFLLTLSAGKQLKATEAGMDYVFVQDISGSMGDDGKLLLSKNSVSAFIEGLAPTDRFEVMTFNVQPNALYGTLKSADAEARRQAAEFMHAQQARGGTVLAPAVTSAYRYGTADRTLNVVILSDGMTEQKERRTLLQLIRERPRNARVFCIGVGNEVNRPLLEQLAEDSGGLAAFVSRGDDFIRQAAAFRRKLMHPVVTELQIDFKGMHVYDLEPQELPNLFHGSPVRIYGRYSGSGEATVTVTGDIRGTVMQQSTPLLFPATDNDNPEIERMWAWKRIDGLLKHADRTGSRSAVIDEVIRLGEDYSIVTEYTSFLVLENDQEYQPWKIERRNLRRFTRDRRAQEARRKDLETLRQKAVADIGPQPAAESSSDLSPTSSVPPVSSPTAQPRSPSASNTPSQSRDLDFGTGPVGPLFVGLAWWMSRRRKRK